MTSKTNRKSKTVKAVKAPKVDRAISQRVAASWEVKKTAKERATRTAVRARGKEYPSFLAAVTALKLSPVNHRSARRVLKTTGRCTFRDVNFTAAA